MSQRKWCDIKHSHHRHLYMTQNIIFMWIRLDFLLIFLLSLNIVSVHGNHKFDSNNWASSTHILYTNFMSFRLERFSKKPERKNEKETSVIITISAAIKSRNCFPPEASRYFIISDINSNTPKWTYLCYFHHLPA